MPFSALKFTCISFALLSQACSYQLSENDPKDYDFDFLSLNNEGKQWRLVAAALLQFTILRSTTDDLLKFLRHFELVQKQGLSKQTYFEKGSKADSALTLSHRWYEDTRDGENTLLISITSREFSVEVNGKRVSLKTAGLLKDFGVSGEKYYFKVTFHYEQDSHYPNEFVWLVGSLSFPSDPFNVYAVKSLGEFEFPNSPLPKERFFKEKAKNAHTDKVEGYVYSSVKISAVHQKEALFFLASTDNDEKVSSLSKKIETEERIVI